MDSEEPSDLITQVEALVEASWRKVLRRKEALAEARIAHEEVVERLKILKHRKTMNDNNTKIAEFERTLDTDWIQPSFPWSVKANSVLKSVFKFDSFRPKQLAAINATLSKKDVILIMPTGGGKSLVYQLPAILDSGVTIVVSPLLALIEDQIRALEKIGVGTATINSTTDSATGKKVYADLSNHESSLKLLYVTPEYIFKSKRFLNHLKKCYESGRISRLAIDEVHCCSMWGHDFRPNYGLLNTLRDIMPDVPTLGVTATATREVLGDILEKLSLKDALLITAPFNRPNLFYGVISKPSSGPETIAMLEKLLKEDYKDETGIIYTSTITETVHLATELKNKGLKVAPYHAQLEPATKTLYHERWVKKRYQAVIATIAFGMGIDLPDVRFVIHHAMPKSLESLYQESGRAGRDGLRADCLVMFSPHDYLRIVANTVTPHEEKKTSQVLTYCLEAESCRRSILAKYFDELVEKNVCNKMCDNCTHCTDAVISTYNLKTPCKEVHAIIQKALSEGQKLTLNKLLDSWYKKGPKKIRVDACKIPKFNREKAELIISFLLLQGFLRLEKNFNMFTAIAYLLGGKAPADVFMQTAHKLYGVEGGDKQVSGEGKSAKRPRIEDSDSD